jgi:hypothetical protein
MALRSIGMLHERASRIENRTEKWFVNLLLPAHTNSKDLFWDHKERMSSGPSKRMTMAS